MKSDKESVTVVTAVTPYRGVYPLKNVDDSSLKNDINVLNLLKNRGKSTQCSILEWCGEEKGGRYTLPYTVTSVTSVTSVASVARIGDYTIIPAYPATGILYTINNFLSGQVRMRGIGGGRYPANYLDFIDNVFGVESNTIEVCSRSVKDCFTVDINPECNPDLVADAQLLTEIPDNTFSRWRCDPPYNENTAKQMYGTPLPHLRKLLKAGARVVKPNSLMFLLCSQNYQWCPPNVKRIGFIDISVVPNNETRVLNIYVKLDDYEKVVKRNEY